MDDCPHGMADPAWCVECRPVTAPRGIYSGEVWVNTTIATEHVAHIRHGQLCLCDPTDTYAIRWDGDRGQAGHGGTWYASSEPALWQQIGNNGVPGVRRCKHCENAL